MISSPCQPVDQIKKQAFGVRCPDERLTLLIDDVFNLAGLSIDIDHPQPLMASIDFLEGKMRSIPIPEQPRIGIAAFGAHVDAIDGGLDLLLRVDLKQIQFERVKSISRQRIGCRVQNSPAAAARR